MRDMLRNPSRVLSSLCCVAILAGAAVSTAAAQGANASSKPLTIAPAGAPEVGSARRTPQQATKPKVANRKAANRKVAIRKEAKVSEPAPQRYFVEFRSRTAQSYGHTFVVHGPINGSNTILPSQVAGLHPAGSSPVTYLLGHVLPVPAETGASDGDTDEQYLTAKYRVEMDEAKYQRVMAFIRDLQSRSKVWTATTYNCNAFAGEIAHFIGLRTPSRMEYPEDYINGIRRLNGG